MAPSVNSAQSTELRSVGYGAVSRDEYGDDTESGGKSSRKVDRATVRSHALSLKENGKWLASQQSSVRVETYSAFSRQKGLIQHGLAKTGLSEYVPDSSELYEVLLRATGEGPNDENNARTSSGWRQKLSDVLYINDGSAEKLRRYIARCTFWSFVVNLALAFVKMWSTYVSGSLAVLASLVDSLLDLAQAGVLYVVERRANLPPDTEFPVGRSRLEPVGVILCAQLMAVGSVGVILQSMRTLIEAAGGHGPRIDVSPATLSCLTMTVISKAILWAYCAAVAHKSSTALALAEDHANDVGSNAVAIISCGLTAWTTRLWWCDSVGAILISLYIMRVWYLIACAHVEQIVGKGASEDQIKQLAALAASHSPGVLYLEGICAYHFGPNFIVELTMLANDGDCSIATACELVKDLEKSIETLSWVERCFCSVHAPALART